MNGKIYPKNDSQSKLENTQIETVESYKFVRTHIVNNNDQNKTVRTEIETTRQLLN